MRYAVDMANEIMGVLDGTGGYEESKYSIVLFTGGFCNKGASAVLHNTNEEQRK